MRRTTVLLALLLFLGLHTASPAAAEDGVPPRPRLIQIQVDGLSPLLVDALMNPDEPEKLARLPDPDGFRRAIRLFRQQTGQQDLLPNLRRYFYEQGVHTQNMFAASSTLSAAAWGVIQTGQPSVVKRHMTFSRSNGYLRGHLDGLRDTFELVTRRARKTSAVWELDQAGVSLFADGFNPLRRYEIPQIYYRLPPVDYLKQWPVRYATTGRSFSDLLGIFRGHMKRRVEGMDYPDFTEEFLADHIAEKILAPDFARRERYDYITAFFTVDHQHHVDPNPENLVHRMVRLDRRLGRIFQAVEYSQRREQTLVVLVSDHGSQYLPGAINLAFPLTRVFRTRLFGGHTVSTLLAEDAAHALTTPLPGVDFPRVYEGPYSPYGKGAPQGGKDDYVTAVIDNFGNSRAEVHLRNNDLNRLHLLLLARGRKLDENQRARWRELVRATLPELWRWLEPEMAGYRAYHHSTGAWIPNLEKRADYYWSDVGARLKGEAERDAGQLRALTQLAELCQAPDPIAWLREHEPQVTDLIPKKYLGRRNSVYQLTHYTIGLDDDLNWVETTVDRRGRPVPMDYISILSHFQVPNPPLSHEPNPVDLIVRSLPTEPLQAALVERGWLDPTIQLRQIIWIVSTAQNNLRRGGQALLLESGDGRVRYLPILHLQEGAEGRFTFAPHNQLDPLGLFYDPAFQNPSGEPAFYWLQRFHTRQEWLQTVHDTAYSIAPLMLTDLAGLNTDPFIENPEFQQILTGFPSQEIKEEYLQGLKWKYASQAPDLLLWSNYLWNFASKNHTPGGSHGGLWPLVTRTSFLLWGGRDFHLPPGGILEEPCTTLDIVPTLAQLLGMLDENGRLVRQAGAVRERPFLPFPGRALRVEEAVAQVAEKHRTVARTD